MNPLGCGGTGLSGENLDRSNNLHTSKSTHACPAALVHLFYRTVGNTANTGTHARPVALVHLFYRTVANTANTGKVRAFSLYFWTN